ncbi:hypothetical protein BS47DRAFT_1287865, partial [Hydnum rufescens UP504]
SSFTPSTGFDVSNEKEWAANLGLLDWDNTSIIFTKRSLMDFLKYAGVTVDPNFSIIQKLPRVATSGKLDLCSLFYCATDTPRMPEPTPVAATAPVVQAPGGFKPSRRVRTVPGGVQTINLFGEDDEASTFPLSKPSTVSHCEPPTSDSLEPDDGPSVDRSQDTTHTGFKPSRRVRERPGGTDSIAAMFADENDGPEIFKPSRRVRTQPGGQSSGVSGPCDWSSSCLLLNRRYWVALVKCGSSRSFHEYTVSGSNVLEISTRCILHLMLSQCLVQAKVT